MRNIASLLFLLAIMIVSMPNVSLADTFTINTTNGTTTTSSTVTIDTLETQSTESIRGAIANLVTEMGGGGDTIESLAALFNSISVRVQDIITVDINDEDIDIDVNALFLVSKDLIDLSLRLQMYMLKEQITELMRSTHNNDTWFVEIVDNY
ncbi:MAG: hypothetical protein LRZ97_00170 [Candidatus Pacebacteria bacterium]|nr:hypothetical protein [Candidatus Paceibacterota bacterium]